MRKSHSTVHAILLAAILALSTFAFAQDAATPPTQGEEPDVRFILRAAQIDASMGFIGVGGDIDRRIDPTLTVTEGDTVQIVLLNGSDLGHYLVIEELGVGAPGVLTVGDRTTITFVADRTGTFLYRCALANHMKAGMLGELVVQPAAAPL